LRFDVCFIDLLNSFKSEDVTRRVLELCLQRLDAGALLMADNALRQGEGIRPKNLRARNVAFSNESSRSTRVWRASSSRSATAYLSRE